MTISMSANGLHVLVCVWMLKGVNLNVAKPNKTQHREDPKVDDLVRSSFMGSGRQARCSRLPEQSPTHCRTCENTHNQDNKENKEQALQRQVAVKPPSIRTETTPDHEQTRPKQNQALVHWFGI